MLKRKEGIISHTYEVDENRLKAMIKGTVLEKYKQASSSEIKQEINKLQPISKEGKTKIVIDHCFDVKGVGTVVLGKVTQGKVKQYDNLKLLPNGSDVMIKSIQMHDDPVEEAVCPARVGLSVKGVKVDDITRGDYLCEDETQNVQLELELDFTQNPFYKNTISENQMCLVSVGMQIKAGKFKSIKPLVVQLDKPMVCDKNEICIILKPESTSVRIVGSGPIR